MRLDLDERNKQKLNTRPILLILLPPRAFVFQYRIVDCYCLPNIQVLFASRRIGVACCPRRLLPGLLSNQVRDSAEEFYINKSTALYTTHEAEPRRFRKPHYIIRQRGKPLHSPYLLSPSSLRPIFRPVAHRQFPITATRGVALCLYLSGGLMSAASSYRVSKAATNPTVTSAEPQQLHERRPIRQT